MEKTLDELLEHGKHYVNRKAPVFVFEHGTVVISARDADAAKIIMKRWDLDDEGQGSALGDFTIMKMDDDVKTIVFLAYLGVAPIVFAVRTPAEMGPNNNVGWSEQELRQCLEARHLRTLDARERNIVRSFVPEGMNNV
jgi:hypothetical protein